MKKSLSNKVTESELLEYRRLKAKSAEHILRERDKKADSLSLSKLSQEQVRNEAGFGLTKSILQRYEDSSNNYLGTPETLIGLSKYYGVSTDYLLGLENNPSPNPELREIYSYIGLSESTVNALKDHVSRIENESMITARDKIFKMEILNKVLSDSTLILSLVDTIRKCVAIRDAYSFIENGEFIWDREMSIAKYLASENYSESIDRISEGMNILTEKEISNLYDAEDKKELHNLIFNSDSMLIIANFPEQLKDNEYRERYISKLLPNFNKKSSSDDTSTKKGNDDEQ